MANGTSKLRFWQSSKRTMQVAETGFDVLKVLAKAKRPISLTDLQKAMNAGEIWRGMACNAILVLHKTGNVTADGRVNRIWLSADTTRISITPAGRQLLNESRSRLEFGRRLLKKS